MTLEKFELSRSQHAIFQMESFLSGRGFYVGGIARVRGAPSCEQLACEQLAAAAEKICTSLDVFRIGFVSEDGGEHWHGIRRSAAAAGVETIDFSGYADPEQAFESWSQRLLLLNEDLALAPIRMFVVRFSRDQAGWFVKAHHAAVDGVALSNLMEQCLSAFEGKAGREPVPFSIIAERERLYEATPRAARDAAYWRSLFNDAADATRIGSRFPIGDYRGTEPCSQRVRVAVTPGQNEVLQRFVLGGGSVFRLFFAAVAHVQMAIEDSNGVLLQAPMQNRWREDERHAVAMAVAPVLIPVFRKAGATAAESYRAIEQSLRKALVHSRYAPATRWREFACAEWQRIIPAFGVSYQTGEFRRSTAEIDVEIDHGQAVEAMFATIHVHRRFEAGVFGLEADFRRIWSADRCHAFLEAVLSRAIEGAEQIGVGPAPACASATPAMEPISMHLHAAFERYADRVLFKRTTAMDLTYRQGAHWMRAFAAALRREPAVRFGKGPVLLLGRRVPEVALAYLACLQEHIPVVIVCPATPAARLESIARNSRAMCCIHVSTDQLLAESLRLASFCAPTVREFRCGRRIEKFSEDSTPPGSEPAAAESQLAYILYTSGSSGEPKGVAISQTALASYALAAKTAYAADAPFNVPWFTAFGFDLTQTSILIPVLSGGFMQAHETDILDDPTLLGTLLADEALTGIKCTPAHLAMLIEHGAKRQNPLTCVVGGESLSAALVRRALHFLPHGSRVINEYGPTEATVGCSVHTVSALDVEQLSDTATMPIGVPLGSAEMSIRDSWGQAVVRGFNGEIWIGGPVLADGYLDDAVQTQARFVRDQDGRRWFRSGDLGLEDRRGRFHCLGRIDEEFKIRGHRIHPAEIEKAVETVLATLHADGCSWALKALKLTVDGAELIALCSSIPVPHEHPEFRRRLRERIAAAWLPGAYCTVQPWPINANGKVDSATLTAAALGLLSARTGEPCSNDAGSEENGRRFELPAWLDAAFLRPIWPEGVDLGHAFLDLGGDSIKAIRLAALLAREGVRISATELLTASSLGLAIEAACAVRPDDVAVEPIAADSVQAGWLQHLPSVRWLREQRLAHVDRLQQGVVVELAPGISPERINAAVAMVEARHRVFSVRADSALSDFHFSSLERERPACHVLQPDERLEHRSDRLQREIRLATQPSAHEVVIDPRLSKAYLLWTCHHLLCDVHSWVYLLDELDEVLDPAPAAAAKRPEFGVFLWGKWLQDRMPRLELPPADDVRRLPAAPAVARVLEVSSARLRMLEQRCKADRSQLIAAALLHVAWKARVLPDEPVVLMEGHGRLFAEAQVPAAWSVHLSSAVGWFTSFTRLQLDDMSSGSHGLLRALKSRLHSTPAWTQRLGDTGGHGRPTVCINDIGAGLSGDRTWRNFVLMGALSGGARHPDEQSVADFELLVREQPDAGAVCVELRLGTLEADVHAARSYLQQLGDTLNSWESAAESGGDFDHSALGRRDFDHSALGRPDFDDSALGRRNFRCKHALIPSDFPLCQLTQAELDDIVHGAAA
jgi:amino acid adenylation domain-containing protein